MANVVVLGTGMVGLAIANDLGKSHEVTGVDRSESAFEHLNDSVNHQVMDLSIADNVKGVIADADLVVCAVPGFMGYRTLEAIINAGKNVVDISFFPEDCFGLDELAKERGVTAVVDCGVAPGLSNIILGYHNANETITSFVCQVGGLPKHPTPPFNYKAPFSPVDVIEEYTRPARIRRGGKDEVVPPLTGLQEISLPNAGLLESFWSDGLRSLLHTMDIPDMEERTLRYPGHANLMKTLSEGGFFDEKPIKIDEKEVIPLKMTQKLLFKHWRLSENEQEFTVMDIEINVATEAVETQNSASLQHHYFLYDERDENGVSSMSRTTGYTCTAVAELVLSGDYAEKGISPPEFVGAKDGCFQKVLKYLEERGIKIELA
jgi:saccharopine dehydrogenase-like NADP-dependent oxidoreductase